MDMETTQALGQAPLRMRAPDLVITPIYVSAVDIYIEVTKVTPKV